MDSFRTNVTSSCPVLMEMEPRDVVADRVGAIFTHSQLHGEGMFLKGLTLVAALALPTALAAQNHEHAQATADGLPQRAGQATFAAIAEIVAILLADPTTDWSKVNIESLRQHLLDMDDVTMRSQVKQEEVPGGARFTVTGAGRVTAAIRRMARAHSAMVAADPSQQAGVDDVEGGARLTIVARDLRDTVLTGRIRALGFYGILATGAHHGSHHLALARGTPPASHGH